jgi:hypothetical protein
LREAAKQLIGHPVEIIIGVGDPHAIQGILKAVGMDYILIEQPGNLAFVYPEDITIFNVRTDEHGSDKRKRDEPEIS